MRPERLFFHFNAPARATVQAHAVSGGIRAIRAIVVPSGRLRDELCCRNQKSAKSQT
jgi:hypothetical protein